MRWKKYGVIIEMTGITQKQTAKILADYFHTSFEYTSDNSSYLVMDNQNRKWLVELPQEVMAEKMFGDKRIKTSGLFRSKLITPLIYENDFNKVGDVLEKIEDRGGLTNESTSMEILIDTAGIESSNKFTDNLIRLQSSKKDLICRALQLEGCRELIDLSKVEENGIVKFSDFKSSISGKAVKGYVQFCQAISNYADTTSSLKDKPNSSQNDKFVMRTFLVRIGMLGKEFSESRKMFTEHLKGDSAWVSKVDVETKNGIPIGQAVEQEANVESVRGIDEEETKQEGDIEQEDMGIQFC